MSPVHQNTQHTGSSTPPFPSQVDGLAQSSPTSRKRTLRSKITLWFAVAMVLMAVILVASMLGISERVIRTDAEADLIHAVDASSEKVSYYEADDDEDWSEIGGEAEPITYLDEGWIVVEPGFAVANTEGISIGLYDQEGSLLYGDNPLPDELDSLGFDNAEMRQVTANGSDWYVYDRVITLGDDERMSLYLRGMVSSNRTDSEMNQILSTSFALIPIVLAIALIGGYLLARRSMRPVEQLANAAEEISSGTDLKRRLEVTHADREFTQLTESFNGMIERLDESFEAERRFTSDASHELRTPLAVINAECEFALSGEQSGEGYRESLQTIARQSTRMANMVEGMLDLTRLERGTVKPKLESMDLSELVESVVRELTPLAERGMTLRFDGEPGVHCQGDRALLQRVIENLVTNGLRYGKDEGTVRIAVHEKDGQALLSVSDDGIGIAIKDQAHLFERFYRADDSRAGTGAGLGLALCDEIARAHGGGIAVESELGIGSAFTVWIPQR